MYLENIVLAKWLGGMAGKTLDSDDTALYQLFIYMKKTGHGIIDGDKKLIMQRIWKMSVKHGVFSEDRSMKEKGLYKWLSTIYCPMVIT